MTAATLPAENHLIDCQALHAELLDLTTQFVWQTHAPMTTEEYAALSLPKTLIRVGIGSGVMDAHFFRRSPGAEADGPVSTQKIDGHLFIHCATPPAAGPELPYGENPKLLRVDKHHSLVFEAGREVDVIRAKDGRDFIQVISPSPRGGGALQDSATGPSGTDPSLPSGWKIRTVKIHVRTTIDLPCPTEAWFFADGSSYQGPINSFDASSTN